MGQRRDQGEYRARIAATQGRGYWILDDLTTLHQLTDEVRGKVVHTFTPRPTLRIAGRRSRNPRAMGTNPSNGVVLRYLLAEEPAAETKVSIRILDAEGSEIQSYVRKPNPDEQEKKEEDESRTGTEPPKVLDAKKGLNEFVWDLRYPGAERFPKMVLWNGRLAGP